MFDRLVVSILVDEVVGGFFISVPPGHVAVVYDRGRGVLNKIYSPGLHLKIPFWQIAKLFNAQTLEYSITKGLDLSNEEIFGDSPINCVTSDNKLITIEGTILFKINKNMLPQLWETIGDKFVSKLVRPASRSRIRQVIARYTYQDVITKNRKDIETEIEKELDNLFDPKGLTAESVLLSEVKLV
jgi:regulator of protease activity HflC (stomatin/prohibitin superfamily)